MRLRIREHGSRDQGAWIKGSISNVRKSFNGPYRASRRVMTDRQVNALAAFIAEGRPDFDAPGVVAELRRQREHFDPWQLAAAMCKRASDPANTTPRLQPFDREGFVTCRRHPTASTRRDGTCGVCFSEARGVEYEPRHPDIQDAHPLKDAMARIGASDG